MAGGWVLWLSCWLLYSTLALLGAEEKAGRVECMGKDGLLMEMVKDVEAPSPCVLSCTAMTYGRMLDSRKALTIHFKSSETDERGEFCWSTHMQCNSKHRLQSAYILLPLRGVGGTPRLQKTSHTHRETLQPHTANTLLAEECGLRFDVTNHFAASDREPLFCVQITPQQQGIMGVSLRCSPFLVTTWWNQGGV